MVDTKAKGTRAELIVRDTLRDLTGLNWQRTPGSGAFGAQFGLKGDLYIPNEKNRYSIEVKHYKDDHINSRLLTGKEPQFLIFWEQACRQAEQTDKEPLLIFKFDRSKIFVAFTFDIYNFPADNCIVLYTKRFSAIGITLLEDWIIHCKPTFIG